MVFSTLLEYAAVSYLGNRKWKPRPALIVTSPPLQSADYAPLPPATDAAGAGFLMGQMSPVLPAAGMGHKVYRKYENDGRTGNRERVNPSFRFSGETFDNVIKAQNAVQVYDTGTETINKKLSYCCDSRSYCVQYFDAIHCEHNISTSE